MKNPFFEAKEAEAVESFEKNGYLIFPLENPLGLAALRKKLFQAGKAFKDVTAPGAEDAFFDKTREFVPIDKLNAFRMSLISSLARDEEVRPLVYSLARPHLQWIVGNELAMQRACNLSIQLPEDTSSLLPIHGDTWQGNSPFEVVFWLPLVNVYQTKSMYILPKEQTQHVVNNFKKYYKLSSEELYQEFKSSCVWMDIPLGHGLIFSHALLHGNRVNAEKDARWSMNTRFKPLLSPYSSKELGESFLPITLRPATRFGHEMRNPEVL
jgi:sporadic carbohydrate cluster 2OG-Fe(II) oxygenase